MDTQGFRTMLKERNVPIEKLDPALALAEQFDNYARQSDDGFSTETTWAFSKTLIEEKQNTEENFITLARYGLFIKSNPVFVAFLEAIDGGEAQENLYKRAAEQFGATVRDEVFAGIGVVPFGIPTPEKPGYMQPVIERLENIVGVEACQGFLSECLRDLHHEHYVSEREVYESCKDVDEYLAKKKERFVEQLKACQREGRLFFAQEITDDVLEFVRKKPEIGGGVRDGDVVYETKIPFMTREYLIADNETLKRFHYCHCPWARYAIKNNEKVTPTFCNCSAGFHKKPWESIYGKKIKADVLESVLQGDARCRFAIHLPE